MTRFFLRGTLCVAALLLVTPAFAHATLEVTEARPETTYKGVVRVPHGCAGQATHTVRITIPEGVVAVKPMPKPGWTLTLQTGAYARPYTLSGKPVAEGVKTIVWSGGRLPDEHYDEFVFRARITDALKAGETAYFPIVQECDTASEHWVEIPSPGADGASLKSPAPGVRIIAATAQAGTGPSGTFKAGAITVEAPWSRATPGGAAVAAGYMRILNSGPEPDRLVGGTAAVAGRFEVHQMSNEGGIMRMGPVPGGLLIPPGGAVELKPGGYHAMLMDLRQPLREGDTVTGTLLFEKAGPIAISYRVGGLGAQAPAAHHHH